MYTEASWVIHSASSRRKRHSKEERHAFPIHMPAQACICPSPLYELSLCIKFLPLVTSLEYLANGVLKAYFTRLGDICSPWEREVQSTRERNQKESLKPLLSVSMCNPTIQPFSWPNAWNPKSFFLNVISLLWSCVSKCWKMTYLKQYRNNSCLENLQTISTMRFHNFVTS